MERLHAFRPWFWAAAAYNAVWGVIAGFRPNALFRLLGIPLPNYPSMFQAIGMMVGVYAIGYWLIARDPVRFGPFVYIGIAGKLLGPLGFIVTAARGELPWSFGWINLTNDLIWLPAFILFALRLRQIEKLGPG